MAYHKYQELLLCWATSSPFSRQSHLWRRVHPLLSHYYAFCYQEWPLALSNVIQQLWASLAFCYFELMGTSRFFPFSNSNMVWKFQTRLVESYHWDYWSREISPVFFIIGSHLHPFHWNWNSLLPGGNSKVDQQNTRGIAEQQMKLIFMHQAFHLLWYAIENTALHQVARDPANSFV